MRNELKVDFILTKEEKQSKTVQEVEDNIHESQKKAKELYERGKYGEAIEESNITLKVKYKSKIANQGTFW